MSPITIHLNTSDVAIDRDLVVVQDFLAEHGDALENASELLGGSRRARHWRSFLDEIATERQLTRGHRSALVEMHRLLSLEGVEIQGSEQSACFAAIDPMDPVVQDLCLLADNLAGILEQISDQPAQHNGYDTRDAELLSVA